MTVPLPKDENERLRALGRYVVFDTATHRRLSRTLRLVANAFDISTAALNLVAKHVVWCKAFHGVRPPMHDRQHSFCAFTIAHDELFVLEDARQDERFKASPLLKKPFSIRFYAGSPVRTEDGLAIGCLVLYDTRPRRLSDQERKQLEDFAALISEDIVAVPGSRTRQLQQTAKTIDNVAVFEAVSTGVCVIDVEGSIIYANPAFAEVHGYEADDILERSFTELMPREARDRSQRLHEAFFAGAPLPEDTLRTRTRDGDSIGLSIANRIAELPDGRRLRVITILKVHEERSVVRQSSWKEEQYRYVINNARDIIFQIDDVGRWVFLNDAWERITGFTAEECIGNHFFRYLHPDDREAATQQYARFIDEARPAFAGEWRVLTLGSGIRWLEFQADLRTDAHGSTLGAMGTIYDVTSRRDAELSLHHMENAQDAVASVTDLILHYHSEDSNRRIHGALESIGLYSSADRSYLVCLDAESRAHRMVVEWCAPDQVSFVETFREIPGEIMPWYSTRLVEEGPVVITDVHKLSPEAENERLIFQAKGVRAVLAIPLIHGGEVRGYVACERSSRTEWSEDSLRVLKICGEIMLSAHRMNELEQDVKRLRRGLDFIARTSTEYIVALKEEGRIEFASPAFERALKAPPGALEGMPFSDLMYAADWPPVREAIKDAGAAGRSRKIRFRIVVPDLDEPLPLEAEFVLREGGLEGLIMFAREAAPGYLVREIFGRTERRFQEIVERAAELVVIFNDEGRIRYVNPAAEAVIGTPVDRLVATHIAEWIAADEAQLWQNLYEQAVAAPGEPAGAHIFRLVPRGGQPRSFALTLTNLSEHPAVGGFVLMGLAIRKAALIEKPAAKPVPERESVLGFLANISHEIRTPLSGILGFAGVLADELDGPHQEFAALIEQSGKRLMDTLNSVLDLARLESGKVTPRREQVNIIDEAREVVTLLNPLAERKDLSLELIAHQDPIQIKLDRAFLHRILHNLVGNSIKFTHSGGVELSVSVVHSMAKIQVSDTGIGMSDEYISRLFEEFSQERADLDDLFEGTGLGLAITRRLVDALNGEISVSSRKGEGTTFTVTLPGVINQGEAAETEEQTLGNTTRLPILVVDDNHMSRILVDRVLGRQYEVDTTALAEEALELARSKEYALVILDIALGAGLTGEDLLREIRRLPAYDRIPFLAMTAYALPGDREHFLSAGFDYYLGKPFTSQELSDLVDRILASESV